MPIAIDRLLIAVLITTFAAYCAPPVPHAGPPGDPGIPDGLNPRFASSTIDPPRAALDHPVRGGSLGSRCDAVTPCSAGFHCDDDDARGFCTRSCVPSGGADREAAVCLDENGTCVAFGDDSAAPGLCALACDPLDREACPPGRACTAFAWAASSRDAPGCFPFCRGDDDCATGTHCNVRTGECGAHGADASLAPDGTACDPRDREPFCRGFCFAVATADVDRGVCASLVDRNAGTPCPDSPDRIAPIAWTNDGLAMCAYRTCDRAHDCPPDTQCGIGERDGLCVPR